MHMDGGDIAVVTGGGAASLTFVLGVVQRYVGPRLDALRDRTKKLEAENAALQRRCDEIAENAAKARSELREHVGTIVTKAHDRLNPIEASVSELKGELRAASRRRRGEAE